MDVRTFLAELDAEAVAESQSQTSSPSSSTPGLQPVLDVLNDWEVVEHGGPDGGAGVVVAGSVSSHTLSASKPATLDTPLAVRGANRWGSYTSLKASHLDLGTPHTPLPYHLHLPSLLRLPLAPPSTRLQPAFRVAADATNALQSYVEHDAGAAQATAANSGSLLRAPAASGSFIRGSTNNRPFRPGFGATRKPLSSNHNGSSASSSSSSANLGMNGYADASADDILNDATPPSSSSSSTSTSTSALSQQGASTSLAGPGGSEWAVRDESDTSNFHRVVPDMAMKYPFELDPFQKRAVMHLERGENVFVAAHTSAGKTVVAEYAISLSQKHMTRTIYTSPIKALSNQKFRDFTDTFDDVGLLTGDMQVNPEATCLVCTTEILRSMLYKGSDCIRDTEWVIFDEVHYVNDSERGVVWEEIIVLLPDHVGLILLSATVANTFEFADWVGRTKQRPVYVVSTNKRPVPLAHHIYVRDKMFPLVSSDRQFNDEGYSGALRKFHRESDDDDDGKNKRKKHKGYGARMKAEASQWNSMVKDFKKEGLLPCVVFSFSKRVCEQVAFGLKNISLVTSEEAHAIHVFTEKCLSALEPGDRELPQVLRVRDLLKRGIGVHHGGLLPIIKEMVEMLFGRGLCKILYATETFAMGVNMPAKCVVFNQLRKHDGTDFRTILPGEYTQMAGRAGRRGLDAVGTVIINGARGVPEASDLIHMILGKPYALESQFRLTYGMVLNLHRIEDMRVEDMIKRSFAEADNASARPELVAELEYALEELDALDPISCLLDGTEPKIEEYHLLVSEAKSSLAYLNAVVLSGRNARSLLSPGRVVVYGSPYGPALGIVLRYFFDVSSHSSPFGGVGSSAGTSSLAAFLGEDFGARTASLASSTVHVLVLDTSEGGAEPEVQLHPWAGLWLPPASAFVGRVVPLSGSEISGVTHQVLDHIVPQDLIDERNTQALNAAARDLYTLASGLTGSVGSSQASRVDIVTPSAIGQESSNVQVVEKEDTLMRVVSKLASSKCHGCPHLCDQYARAEREHTLKKTVNSVTSSLSDDSLRLLPDYHQRVSVLQSLQYLSEDETVLLKGRVACEINTADELILTELIFDNGLAELDSACIVALLSMLIFQRKTDVEPTLIPQLLTARTRLEEIATRLGLLQAEAGLDIDPHEYVRSSLKGGLMEVVYEWALGKPFAQICELTDVEEGTIVRTIVRLDDACREVKNAARIIGNSALYEKLTEASLAIKRDIVFAPSLYVKN